MMFHVMFIVSDIVSIYLIFNTILLFYINLSVNLLDMFIKLEFKLVGLGLMAHQPLSVI